MPHLRATLVTHVKEYDLVGKVDTFILAKDLNSGLTLAQISRVCTLDKPGQKLFISNTIIIRNRLGEIIHTSDNLSLSVHKFNSLI